jgi:alpha-aminoadipate carrier protein LysW
MPDFAIWRRALVTQYYLGRQEDAVPSCPECENDLGVEIDEVEEGDVVTCDECGSEYEIVGVEPLELVRVDDELEEDDLFEEDEEEE